MLKFISAVQKDGVQDRYRDQYHWESRAAHIFNKLWIDVMAKLPVPDLSDVPYDDTVMVVVANEINQGPIQRTGLGADTLNDLGMGTVNFTDAADRTMKCSVIIRSDVDDRWRTLDLDIFRHELIHCHQWLWEIRQAYDHTMAQGWTVGDANYTDYQNSLAKEHNDTVAKSSEFDHMSKEVKQQKIEDQIAQGTFDNIEQVMREVIVPSQLDNNFELQNEYCEISKPEKDMVIDAGRVWTPELTYNENLILYHNVFNNSFHHIKDIWIHNTGQAGTRQQMEKLNIVDTMLSHIKASPDLARKLKLKSHQYLKTKYNYIEKSELQMEAA